MRLVVAVGMAYFVAAWLGLTLLTNPENVAVLWPASGIAAGVLIMLGPQSRLPVAVGVIVASLAAHVLANKNAWAAPAFALCNAGEVVLAAGLIRRWCGPGSNLETLPHVLGLFWAAARGAGLAAVGASAAIALFRQPTVPPFAIWSLWFASDALGIVTMAPVLIGLGPASRQGLEPRELTEGTIALVALTVASVQVFALRPGPWATVVPPAVLLPVVLWLAARCRPVVAAAAVLIIAVAIAAAMAHGIGTYGDPRFPVAERLLAAQTGILTAALCALVLAALFAERRRHEATLEAKEARLRSILEATNVVAWEIDLIRDTVHVTGPAGRSLNTQPGLQPFSLLTSANAVHPADRERVRAEFEAALRGKAPYRAEFRLALPDGSARWLTSEGIVVRDAEGRPQRVLGINHDITERKRAEEALRESEARFRSTFENAAVGIGHVALDGRLLRINDSLCRITGYTRDELLLRRVEDISHPDDVEAGSASTDRLVAGAVGAYRRQKRCVRKDGTTVWVAVTVSLARKPDGSPDYFISVIEDITKAKEAEATVNAALVASEHLRLALASGQMGTWEVDYVRQVLVHSLETQAILGLQPGASLPWSERFTLVLPEDRPALMAVQERLRAGHDDVAIDHRIRRRDGEIRWLSARGRVVERDADSAPVRVVGIVADITARKQAEEHIQLLMREISHRAKNLLAVVQVMARQTAGEVDPQVFAERFGDRLAGLAASHDLLVKSDWKGVDTADLVRSQLSHFGNLIGTRFTFDGPLLTLRPAAAQKIGCALLDPSSHPANYAA